MRDLAFVVLLAGLVPLCFLRPWIGVLAWCWISFMNPHRLMWSFASQLPVAIFIGAATLLGLLITKDRKSVPGRPEMVLLGLLALHYTFTTVFAMVPDEAWSKWDQTMKILLMTFVTTMLIYGRNRITALMLVISLSIGYYGVKGGIWSLLHGGENRVRGPDATFIGDNNALALALVMVIPLMLVLAEQQKQRWARWALFSAAAISGLATLFTYSRGGMLGLATVVVLLLLRSKQKVLAGLVVAAGVGFVLWFAPPKLFDRAETIKTYEEDSSAMLRLQAWSVSTNIALERPFTGGGFKIEWLPDPIWMSYANREYDQWGTIARSPHSIYFGTLGEHGFVGLGIYLAVLVSALASLQKSKRESRAAGPELAWIGAYSSGLQIAVIGFAVSGTFQPLPNFDLYFMFVAVAAILQRELKEAARVRTSLPVSVPTEQSPAAMPQAPAHPSAGAPSAAGVVRTGAGVAARPHVSGRSR